MSGKVNPGVQHTCRGGGLAEEVGQFKGDPFIIGVFYDNIMPFNMGVFSNL